MPDFWRSSGYHLLDPGRRRLGVTNAFLRAYFLRPEMRPVAESCAAERKLHARLLDDPRLAIGAADIAELADADARENYSVLIAFRDRLVAAGTIEDAYLGIMFNAGPTPTPPLFVDQLAHVIVRALLDGRDDPLVARAGELFFRPQKITINDGAIMLADEETVEMLATSSGYGSLGKLLVEASTPLRTVELDVLNESNAANYWARDERYDTVLDLTFGRPGLDALARLLEGWLARLIDLKASIQPVQSIRDERWAWHVGLDAEATQIMNDLYLGRDVEEERLKRVLALFRLEIGDVTAVRPDLAGRPVYLGLAVDERQRLRLKPQNLLVNLPLAARG